MYELINYIILALYNNYKLINYIILALYNKLITFMSILMVIN